MTLKREEILDGIKQLTVLDVAWLVKELETTFGVSAAAPVAYAASLAAGAPAASTAAAPAVEEKTEFKVTLKEVGPNKINVIKSVRELTGLGLKESKELVDAAPKMIRENITKEDADSIAAKLREAGATVTIE